MKHLSAFFRPVTNALSAWSVGLHSFFSHLLISAGSLPQRNVSVTSASAAIVGTPSRRRRGLMLKPLALMLLFLLGSLNVWGEDVEIVSTFAKVKNESPTASFTASNTGNNNVYSTGTTFTITSKENNVWALAPSTSESIYFSMNNSEGGFHLGSGSYDAGDATLTSSTSFSNVTQIKISGKTGKKGSVTISVKVGNASISLKQGSSATFSGSTVATATFISASPISGTVEVTMTDGANNIAYYIESITITTSSGSSDPANYNIPKFAVSIPSGTIGVRCSQHSLRQHTLSRVYALSY